MKLQIAPSLSLPLDAVTSTFGVLAIRGAGKTNTAAVMAEQMYRASLPFVVIDVIGNWWGLRSGGTGKKGEGLQVPIFGGRHGDVPLEKTGGLLLADVVAEQRLSCVLDCSDFSEGEKIRFLTDFAERLYRRNEKPLHLFLEEADDYIPQRPMRDQARLLGAWERIVRRGRARGLGCTLITQRSAAINKNVLTQIETLITLRITSPQDRKAIEGWVDYQGLGREMLGSLPGLENGEAWVWSPHYLKIMERVKIYRRSTFDSAATPKERKDDQPAATLATVDLAAITQRMQDTIERARATDPKALQQRVQELERQLAAAKTAPPPPQIKESRISITTADALRIERNCIKIEKLHGDLQSNIQKQFKALIEPFCQRLAEAQEKFREAGEKILAKIPTSGQLPNALRPKVTPPFVASAGFEKAANTLRAMRESPPGVRLARTPIPALSNDFHLGTGERRILTAIAQYPETGVSREQLTVLTGYKRSSRDTYLQRLKMRELCDADGGRFFITPSGLQVLGDDFEALPTGDALRTHWLERLPTGERRIFEVLLAQYPVPVSREIISDRTGYQRSSRDTYLQRMKARGIVVTFGKGNVGVSGHLFHGGT